VLDERNRWTSTRRLRLEVSDHLKFEEFRADRSASSLLVFGSNGPSISIEGVPFRLGRYAHLAVVVDEMLTRNTRLSAKPLTGPLRDFTHDRQNAGTGLLRPDPRLQIEGDQAAARFR